ncbi:hypothetical protein PIB30_097752 [Stylosanthes scabra]|uniref:Uncharacterized protein n=1 Tax=Stylosanthes scabra TaxID=79078 RepID=A0ABU6UY55_9FABA|nr:hypothetical protein [Stylosanthes scabra]
MPRVKRPTKKSRGASSSMEPPPQDHPLAQWFYNKEDFDLYHSDFASRKVIPPRNVQEAPQQEQEAPQQEEEAQPQEPQAQPSEQPSDQPSLRDIMQAIQTMELNMNQRMDIIEKNQARMLRKIWRVEAYTFSEDEAEDDDDNFWS